MISYLFCEFSVHRTSHSEERYLQQWSFTGWYRCIWSFWAHESSRTKGWDWVQCTGFLIVNLLIYAQDRRFWPLPLFKIMFQEIKFTHLHVVPKFFFFAKHKCRYFEEMFLPMQWKSMGSKTILDPIYVHYMGKQTNIYTVYMLHRKKEMQTGLEQKEDE